VRVKKYGDVPGPQKKSTQNDGTESENGKPFAIIVKKRCQVILHAHLSYMVNFDTRSYLKIVIWPNPPEADKSLRWCRVSSPRHTSVCLRA